MVNWYTQKIKTVNQQIIQLELQNMYCCEINEWKCENINYYTKYNSDINNKNKIKKNNILEKETAR